MVDSRQACVVMILAGWLLTGGCSKDAFVPGQTTRISDDIELSPIAHGVWVHTTYFDLPEYGRCPANGLLVIDGSKAMLIDLPWTDAQTAVLMDWIAQNLGATVIAVIPTHFHQDCMGGLAEAHRRNADSYALDKTMTLATEKQLPVPHQAFTDELRLKCRKTHVVLRYFGPGHTTDNIVAWLPKQKVIFGGCLVKSINARSLGNTADGDVQAYPMTLKNVRDAYPDAQIVVPGHGRWGGTELIDHTLTLCPKEGQG